MAIRIAEAQSQLVLMFDWPSIRFSQDQFEALGQKLSTVDGVISVKGNTTWYKRRRLTIEFGSGLEPKQMLRRMAGVLRSLTEQLPSHDNMAPPDADVDKTGHAASLVEPKTSSAARSSDNVEAVPTETTSLRMFRHQLWELGYGILAIASFAMAWVGLFVPGIPTVPFVILTAHFALKASPALRKRLLSSRMFGPMMRDWQQHGAIQRSVQIQAYVFTVIILVIGFAVAPQVPAVYAVMAIMGALGLILISRIPVIQMVEETRSTTPAPQRANAAPNVA